MKIKNISHLDLRVHPRGTIGWDPEAHGTVEVKAGEVIDLPVEHDGRAVAGRPPAREHIDAHDQLIRSDDRGQLTHDERAALVNQFIDSDAGDGLLAQWDVWAVADEPKTKTKTKDEEAA